MYSVKGRIHRGAILKEVVMVERVKDCKDYLGVLEPVDYPYECPECQSKRVYLCPDGDEFLVCCVTRKCSKENAEESRKKSREMVDRERNRYGDLMSGAEKFNMGARYKNACLSRAVIPPETQEKVSQFLSSPNKTLVYIGRPGCGKTYLSACVLNRLFEDKKEAYYITHRRLVSQMQNAIQESRETYEVIRRVSSSRYLILDDIGSAANTEWQREMVLELIDMRYNKQLPTMYTSNLTREQMTQALGERVASRMFAKDSIVIYGLNEDMR